MLSRRFVLGAGAAAIGAAACGKNGITANPVRTRKLDQIGLQTYTLRDIFEPDPVGTLKMMAAFEMISRRQQKLPKIWVSTT